MILEGASLLDNTFNATTLMNDITGSTGKVMSLFSVIFIAIAIGILIYIISLFANR
jgi:hypothetical protein